METIVGNVAFRSFPVDDTISFKQKALQGASQHDVACYLDNNQYTGYQYNDLDCLIGIGVHNELTDIEDHPFEDLMRFHELNQDWLFGFFAYDLKDKIYQQPDGQAMLSSNNFDGIQMPAMYWYRPAHVIKIKNKEVFIRAENPEKLFKEINAFNLPNDKGYSEFNIRQRIAKRQYIDIVNKIRDHIIEGDIYELNFCQEFFMEEVTIDPVQTFLQINNQFQAPFASFFKLNDKFLLCNSPERFLKKAGNRLISQPMKGTISRSSSIEGDQQLMEQLGRSQKDRAENIMIVDLVRNDLAKTCTPGSVEVEELFGIYSFEQAHQMVSTVVGELREDVHFTEAIKQAFPMGSMTGAPKIAAMQLIEHFEQTKRGLFSGAVGYITPEGDFDLNVVIRSIIYNATNKFLSYQAGGAITFDSDPEKEYEECLIKAKGFLEL